MPRLSSPLSFLLVCLCLAGCRHLAPGDLLNRFSAPKTLRVGMAADNPPLAYKKNNTLAGLETQFAAGLAESAGKKLELVELPRQGLAQALLEEKVDIVMAGMSVADAHKSKLATTDPYLISGQVALVHLDDHRQLGSGTRNLSGNDVRIGVVGGSSGDNLLKGLKPAGLTTRYASAPDGVQALLADTIDAFIFDLPANCYYASLHVDKGLTPGLTLLTREPLAWAVHPKDTATREAANAYLAKIEQNGDLRKMLERAIPFYRTTAYSPKP